jgi:hypothetical protein
MSTDYNLVLCFVSLNKKAKFAHRAKITARISHLAVESKGGRVKSIVTLRGADISHQHTHKKAKFAHRTKTQAYIVQWVCVKFCCCFVYGQSAQECVLCSPPLLTI